MPSPEATAPPPSSTSAAATGQATLLVADAIGEVMGFWNFKPSMGRVWTVLFLSPKPLSADEISRRTELSAGSVSMTLQELLLWGVVRKAWQRGSRRRYFEAETDILSLVTRVFRERELRLIESTIQRIERALVLLQDLEPSSDTTFLRSRLETLLRMARTGRALVDQFAGGGLLDLRSLRDVLRMGTDELRSSGLPHTRMTPIDGGTLRADCSPENPSQPPEDGHLH